MWHFKKKIKKELKQLTSATSASENSIISENEIQHLPWPVKQWIIHSGTINRQRSKNVWLQQSFRMKLKPGQKKWYHAKALQVINTRDPSFIWSVDLKMAPLMFVVGRDKLTNGKGEMQMNLLGLFNIAKEQGEKIDEGTLQRYLGEIAWAPSAAVNPYITWNAIDDKSAEAVLTHGDKSVKGRFYFNDEGNFDKFETDRYKDNKAASVRYKWVIVAREHKEMDGIVVPVHLSATWHLDKGPWTWCSIEIDRLKYDVVHDTLIGY